ncbi:Translation initiation factor eIF-2B subunit delta [Hypsibius exemplaris]|uniref:Translation initiation factor eIF2B subunit delta n=1 Tax=Hypsibius exemplaris TaxID=2072580 RepID=A0A1W0WY41_HYPEX|nr:Translation initiation factor eIF-2B subunit delta [Hypsibius exemplaris]
MDQTDGTGDPSGGRGGHPAMNQKNSTKAERRAIQEAQRARKANIKSSGESASPAIPITRKSSVASSNNPGSCSPSTVAPSAVASSTVASSVVAPSSPSVDSATARSLSNSDQSKMATKHQQGPPVAAARGVTDVARAATRQRSFNSDGSTTVIEVGGALGNLGIFSHLPVPERGLNLAKTLSFSSSAIHPAILKLGVQYSSGIISGSNSRCIALIHTMKQVVVDYETPRDKVLCRDLESRIKPYINFLAQCRPLSVSMGNAIRHIKWLISHTPVDMPDTLAKSKLIEQLDHYVEEKIVLAGKAISETYAAEKINDGDVILTYSCSSLVSKVLIDAHRRGRQFSVVVVDGRPRMEGRELLKRLVRNGVKCSYVHISAISYVMPEISKILVGAECLLANGYVMSRVGTSQIALVAKAFNVPVLVCCETYKFCERVQTDSIVHNELGNPEDLRVPGLWSSGQEEEPTMMSWLNLAFDVTPPDMITMVITEIRLLSSTRLLDSSTPRLLDSTAPRLLGSSAPQLLGSSAPRLLDSMMNSSSELASLKVHDTCSPSSPNCFPLDAL